MSDVVPGLPEGPYPDDWAAVHHLIDEGWMYSLRFDDGVTSAGFLLTPRGVARPELATSRRTRRRSGARCSQRYPTIESAFADATPLMPIAFRPLIQHRLTRAAGERWAMMPHAYAFVDPLFSTGIAWGLRAVERLALAFESAASRPRVPDLETLDALRRGAQRGSGSDRPCRRRRVRGDGALRSVRRAGDDLFRARFRSPRCSQRLAPDESAAWRGFLGVGDPVLEPLPRESLRRLRQITQSSRRRRLGGRSDAASRSGWRARSRRATLPDLRTRSATISIRWTSTCSSSDTRSWG